MNRIFRTLKSFRKMPQGTNRETIAKVGLPYSHNPSVIQHSNCRKANLEEVVMSWSRHKSLQRIRSFRATAPAASINLRNFDLSYMTARAATIQAKMRLGGKSEPLIFDVPPDTAIQVEGVHVYIQMLDFAAAMTERERVKNPSRYWPNGVETGHFESKNWPTASAAQTLENPGASAPGNVSKNKRGNNRHSWNPSSACNHLGIGEHEHD